jgi:hypothetical protein
MRARPGPSGDVRLLVWINGDKGYNGLQKVGDAFTRASGVPVVVQHPEGAPDKFQAAAGAGKGPDIFCWPHDRVGEWAKSGLIVPVRPTPAVRDAIEDAAWQAFTYRGKVWGYPIAIEAVGLIYNRALVPEPPAQLRRGDRARPPLCGRRAARPSCGTTTSPSSPGRCWPAPAAPSSAQCRRATTTPGRSASTPRRAAGRARC